MSWKLGKSRTLPRRIIYYTVIYYLLYIHDRPTDLPFGMLQSDSQLGEHVLSVDVGRETVLFYHVLPDGRQFQVIVARTEFFRRGHRRIGSEPDVRTEERGSLHAGETPAAS